MSKALFIDSYMYFRASGIHIGSRLVIQSSMTTEKTVDMTKINPKTLPLDKLSPPENKTFSNFSYHNEFPVF